MLSTSSSNNVGAHNASYPDAPGIVSRAHDDAALRFDPQQEWQWAWRRRAGARERPDEAQHQAILALALHQERSNAIGESDRIFVSGVDDLHAG